MSPAAPYTRLHGAALIPEMLRGLKEQALGVNELLRHFWRAFPVNTKGKANKVQRVIAALEQMYEQSQAMVAAAQPAERPYVSQMLRPPMRAMDAAMARYDEYARAAGDV
jgi:transcription initiation factor TFIIH subunit 1